MPDPENRVFVRTLLGQIFPDGTRPTSDFKILSGRPDRGHLILWKIEPQTVWRTVPRTVRQTHVRTLYTECDKWPTPHIPRIPALTPFTIDHHYRHLLTHYAL